MLYQIVQVIGITAAGVFISPLILLFAVLLLVLCLYVATHFLAGAREVKRLESNCRSPIVEQLGAVLAGLGKSYYCNQIESGCGANGIQRYYTCF